MKKGRKTVTLEADGTIPSPVILSIAKAVMIHEVMVSGAEAPKDATPVDLCLKKKKYKS